MSNPLPIHHRFGYQTQKHPQKVALILDDQCLTYAEQLSASQLLAFYLIEHYHVESGDVVGLCIDRSIEMVST